MRRELHGVALLLTLTLVACGGPEGSASATLSAVLPSPVPPGAQVVAYGELPADARLTLAGDPVTATPVPDGLQFTVPEWSVAGTHTLTVEAGSTTLSGLLQVVPRLDSVTLQGDTLTVTGAGWSAEVNPALPVHLELSGQTLTPTLAAGRMIATLPEQLPYGSLSVRVVVGGQVSEAKALKREAGAVSGTVTFPGTPAGATLSLQQARTPSATPAPATLPALVVSHPTVALTKTLDGTLNGLEGLTSTIFLALLNATHLSFINLTAAQAALETLQQTGLRVAWDVPVQLDGFEVLSVEAPEVEDQWVLPLLGLEPAWAQSRGEGVVVAVVDTGVALNHPDLQANLLPGYDFVDGDAVPQDLAGHGTHVAGLVAADGKVSGTAPGASLLPVRVLEGTSGGSAFSVAQGVLWAAGLLLEPPNPHPADVINLSLGSSSYSESLAEAVKRAQEAGVVVVAASGNSGGPVAYPAALPGVVAVTALAGPALPYQPWYANRGPGTRLTGFGGDLTQDQDGDGVADGILSTDLSNEGEGSGGYGLRMGTSMASPQVAGLAALALASGTPLSLVGATLEGTATELGIPGYDSAFGYGLATGRSAAPSDPRSYLLALDEGGNVLGWTLVQTDLSFTLDSLPPDTRLTLVAASDEDGDGVLAEAGELVSDPLSVTLRPGEVTPLEPVALTLATGSSPIALEASR